ncbi:LamG-like jellyroll fold domain-containing protein, partial [Elusimicrobiota bacterium]
MKKILTIITLIILALSVDASAAVEYQNKAETTASGIQIIISTPTGCIAGDLLIAFITKDGVDAISTNSDWNVICSGTPGEGNYVQVAWRILTSTDTDWTWTSASETWLGEILCYRGHDAISPIYAVSTNSAINDQYPTAPSVDYTDLASGSLVLQLYGADYDKYDTVPGQLTTRFSNAFGGPQGTCGAGGDKSASGTGTTGTAQFGMTSVDDWVAATVIIETPHAPKNLEVDEIHLSSATLSWDKKSDATKYILEASTATDFTTVHGSSITTNIDLTSLTASSLLANTSYYFRIGGLIGETTYWTETPPSDSTLANPVTDAEIYAAYGTVVTLNWKAHPETPSSSTCEGYIVEASSTNFGAQSPGGTVYSSATYLCSLSTLTVSGLSPNTTYWFRIGAYNWSYTANYVTAGSTKTIIAEPDVSCNRSAGTWSNNVNEFIFTNELGWGGGGVEYYRYVWNQDPTYTSWNDEETKWETGKSTGIAENEGSYYMHVKSYDSSDTGNPNTMDFGPYNYEVSSPTFSNFYSQKTDNSWITTSEWNDDATPNVKISVQDSDYSGLRIGSSEIVASSGTVLLLHLNGDTVDSSGYGNDGTIVNGAGWISTDSWKTAVSTESILNFTGSSGENYVTADSVCNDITGLAFSFGAWVHPTQATAREAVLAFNGEATSNLNELWWADTEGKFSYDDEDTGSVDSQNTFSLDWHFVFVTIDASNNGKLYVDGKEEVEFTTDERPETDGYFSIGTEYDTYPSDGDWFTGLIDEVSVFNRALSAEEVAVMYNSGCIQYSTSGVDGTYTIDPSTTTTVTSGDNGTISLEISTAEALPFHSSEDECYVKFLISDRAGNIAISDAYGIKIDADGPSTIGNLTALPGSNQGDVNLSWTKSTDTLTGCDSYIIKYATYAVCGATVAWWSNATDVTGEPAFPGESMTVGSLSLDKPLYYFAIRTLDDVGNLSNISNVPFIHPKDDLPEFTAGSFRSQKTDTSWIETSEWNDDDSPNVKIEIQDDGSGLRIGSQEIWPDTHTVLLLHMNETGLSSGKTTYDSSVYGNNGEVYYAASIITDTWKTKGSAESIVFFDGVDEPAHNQIQIADSPSLNVEDEFTLSAWIKPITAKSQDVLGFNGAGDERNYEFNITAGNKAMILISDSGSTSQSHFSDATVNLNQWNFVAARYKKGVLLSVTVNGVTKETTPNFDLIYDPKTLYVGSLDAGEYLTFHGLIDEVRIMNRAISDNELACSYNSGCIKYSTSGVNGTYTIDASTSRTVTSGDNGTVSLEISTATSLPFHSSEDDCYVKFLISDRAGNVAVSDAYTVKIDSISPTAITNLAAVPGGSQGQVDLSWTKSTDTVSGCDSYIIKYATYAVNGATDAWWSNAADVAGEPAFPNESMTVGSLSLDKPLYYFAIRTLDNIGNLSDISNVPFVHPKDDLPEFTAGSFRSQRIDSSWIETSEWNDDDTPDVKVQVQDDGSGLRIGSQEVWPDTHTLLLLHMNEPGLSAGETTYDSSIYGNNGVLFIGGAAAAIDTDTWKTSGSTESIVYFSEAGDCIKVPHKAYFSTAPLTAECWFKLSGLPAADGVIFSKRNTDDPFKSWEIAVKEGTNKIVFKVSDIAKVDYEVASDDAIKSDTWYHIVGILEANYDMSLYINGEKQAATNNSGDIYNATQSLLIGAAWDGGQSQTKGLIDEACILSRALSAKEIACRYNSGCIKYSTDGGNAWTIDASTTRTVTSGDNGTVSLEISTATTLPFHSSETDCQIKFMISDRAGNVAVSDAYTVKIDTIPPTQPALSSPVTDTWSSSTTV